MSHLILVADDDKKHQRLLADVLQAAGYETLVVEDGRRAIDLAHSAKPQLILMDIDMPEIDGISAVTVLKADPETQAIPILAVTALAMSTDRQRVLNAGFDGFVGKPIHVKELRAVVHRHLSDRHAHRFPERSHGRSSATNTPRSAVAWRAGSVGRVLVVDDEEKNRKLLRDILEARGHDVFLAEDGEQALTKALAERPDAVLLDVMLPGMDGFEVCRRLRLDARTAHVPILMVTALQDREAMLTGIQAGASDFLTKPVDAEELRLRVGNAVTATHVYDKVEHDRARLEALQSLQDNLTNMIVHDMRSPLLVVSTSFEVLSRGADRWSQEEQRFHALGAQASRELLGMVQSLLDVSRLEIGQMPLHPAAYDLVRLATAASESVGLLARKKGLTLDVAGESATVVVDRDVLHRALVNLLGNAIDFSPERETIVIRVVATDTAARVTVADRGPGIPPEYHQRIFEKFGQVGAQKPGLRRSAGLGLTFCKLAVEAHGGQIGVESQVGQGSTFWLTLPRSDTPGLPDDSPPS